MRGAYNSHNLGYGPYATGLLTNVQPPHDAARQVPAGLTAEAEELPLITELNRAVSRIPL